jgi:hypothetical protein
MHRSSSLGRHTVFIVGLAAAFLAEPPGVLAYVGGISIVPAAPTAGEEVVAVVSGDLPDTCWELVGHQVEIDGRRITIQVRAVVRPGICFQILVPYRFEASLGRLDAGSYEVTASDAQSSVSVKLEVRAGGEPVAPVRFIRGDANADGKVDIADAVFTLEALFGGTRSLPCSDAADANDDGEIDISDPIRTLLFLFAGGPPPPPPGARACGADPSADRLDCESFPPCAPEQGELYRLVDRGIECITWPCPYWLAEGDAGEIEVTDLDLSTLGLSPDEEAKFLRELEAGRLVIGYTVPGPEGPAGVGRTLVVLELVD